MAETKKTTTVSKSKSASGTKKPSTTTTKKASTSKSGSATKKSTATKPRTSTTKKATPVKKPVAIENKVEQEVIDAIVVAEAQAQTPPVVVMSAPEANPVPTNRRGRPKWGNALRMPSFIVGSLFLISYIVLAVFLILYTTQIGPELTDSLNSWNNPEVARLLAILFVIPIMFIFNALFIVPMFICWIVVLVAYSKSKRSRAKGVRVFSRLMLWLTSLSFPAIIIAVIAMSISYIP